MSMTTIRDIHGDPLTVDTNKVTALELFPGAVAVIDTAGVWTLTPMDCAQLDACDAILSRIGGMMRLMRLSKSCMRMVRRTKTASDLCLTGPVAVPLAVERGRQLLRANH